MELFVANLPVAPIYIWLMIAALFLVMEAFGVVGVGMLFGGLAALVVSILIEFNIISEHDLIVQSTIWFGSTTALALALYKPMKRWKTGNESEPYNNIVGTEARVAAGGLMLGKPGKVYWSGTMMNAKISTASTKEAFLENDMVTVSDMAGNQLIVVATGDNITQHKDKS